MEIDGRAAAGPDAHAVALAGNPPLLYVGNRSPGTVSVIDPVTLEVTTTRFVAPMLTHLVEVPDRSLLASAGSTREVLRLAPRSLSILHRTPLPFQPHQIAVSGLTETSGSNTHEGGPR
ncbi:MAG: hypothetical protein GWN82_03890 [Gemmatimonadetes bacterium]|nr:hypothetical protein [Gemmatimonadota bacterium]NIU29888.1 hypothetical protein [Gemmatimonadota bacterium]NIV60295.1 hypothetical protein [Gemmatimonadota bacterium]NIW62958.1 hypothetical protein [Gemmatimonadota bacterium]NIX38337.1 hypothetical protein [Gemmatimonadota bacterium]